MIITNEKEFDELKPWDKLFVISSGSIKSYRFACKHPKIKNRIILVNDNDYTQTTCISTELNDTSRVFLSSYNSYEVGCIMIDQLEQKIEHVKEVYIEEADNF